MGIQIQGWGGALGALNPFGLGFKCALKWT